MKQDPRAKTFILSMIAAFIILHFSLNYMKEKISLSGKDSESLVVRTANSWNSNMHINYSIVTPMSDINRWLEKKGKHNVLPNKATVEQKKEWAIFASLYYPFLLISCIGFFKWADYIEFNYLRKVREGEFALTGEIGEPHQVMFRVFMPLVACFISAMTLFIQSMISFPFIMNIFVSMVAALIIYKIIQTVLSVLTMNQEEEV